MYTILVYHWCRTKIFNSIISISNVISGGLKKLCILKCDWGDIIQFRGYEWVSKNLGNLYPICRLFQKLLNRVPQMALPERSQRQKLIYYHEKASSKLWLPLVHPKWNQHFSNFRNGRIETVFVWNFSMQIIPGCIPKGISVIWPNSYLIWKGECVLTTSCATTMTVIVMVHKDGATTIDNRPGTKENNFICWVPRY